MKTTLRSEDDREKNTSSYEKQKGQYLCVCVYMSLYLHAMYKHTTSIFTQRTHTLLQVPGDLQRSLLIQIIL